ncbi:MAG: hypothetical protein QXT14_02930 [Candidatus Bathyarchaeia archaeon]
MKEVSESITELNRQLRKLEGVCIRMEGHEKELFDMCVKYTSKGDYARAALYADECAEVRKILLALLKSKTALERVLLELHTIEAPEDVVLLPKLIIVLTNLRIQLARIVPEISYEISRSIESLSRLVKPPLELDAVAKEAEKILDEARRKAEEKLRNKPEIPKPCC